MKTLAFAVLFASGLCLSQPADNKSTQLRIAPEPVAPTGFDYGKMSEQGTLNQYRIEKLEEDVKSIRGTIDSFKGAWWAIGSAFGIFVAMVALVFKFLGRHIAFELVSVYRDKTIADASARAESPATQK